MKNTRDAISEYVPTTIELKYGSHSKPYISIERNIKSNIGITIKAKKVIRIIFFDIFIYKRLNISVPLVYLLINSAYNSHAQVAQTTVPYVTLPFERDASSSASREFDRMPKMPAGRGADIHSYAMIADRVYGERSALGAPGADTLINWKELIKEQSWSALLMKIGDIYGFNAQLYKNGNELVLAFEGSTLASSKPAETFKDWVLTNIPNGKDLLQGKILERLFGEKVASGMLLASPQYVMAAIIAIQAEKYAAEKFPTLKIVNVGHSLGGSLAQYATYVTGREAIVFNPEGAPYLPASAKAKMDEKVTQYWTKSSENKNLFIITYYGEYGKKYVVGDGCHGMNCFLDALGYGYADATSNIIVGPKKPEQSTYFDVLKIGTSSWPYVIRYELFGGEGTVAPRSTSSTYNFGPFPYGGTANRYVTLTAATRGAYQYTDWGEWSQSQKPPGFVGPSYWLIGQNPVTMTQLPRSGYATYTGEALTNGSTRLGTAGLTAFFGARTVNAWISAGSFSERYNNLSIVSSSGYASFSGGGSNGGFIQGHFFGMRNGLPAEAGGTFVSNSFGPGPYVDGVWRVRR